MPSATHYTKARCRRLWVVGVNLMTDCDLQKSSTLSQVSSIVVVDVCHYTAVFVSLRFDVILLKFLVVSNRLF